MRFHLFRLGLVSLNTWSIFIFLNILCKRHSKCVLRLFLWVLLFWKLLKMDPYRSLDILEINLFLLMRFHCLFRRHILLSVGICHRLCPLHRFHIITQALMILELHFFTYFHLDSLISLSLSSQKIIEPLQNHNFLHTLHFLRH